MKEKLILNVILVKNPSLHQCIWRGTSRHKYVFTGFTFVTSVKNISIKQEVWRDISRIFIRSKKITNFAQSRNNKHIIVVHDGKNAHKCEFSEKVCSSMGNLKSHIKIIHDGVKNHSCDICRNIQTAIMVHNNNHFNTRYLIVS